MLELEVVTVKIGLALSGGTLRGTAHIGVLDMLQQAGIRPDMIAGTSAGSVIAALYAHGLPPTTLERIALSFRAHDLIDWTASAWDALGFLASLPLHLVGLRKDLSRSIPRGFLQGKKFEQYLSRLLELTPAHEPIPLYVTTVDLHSAESVIFTDGPMPKQADTRAYDAPGVVFLPMTRANRVACVRASCSMPSVFFPAVVDGRTCIDGAIRTNIPAELLFQAGCDKVIAVDLLKAEMSHHATNTFFDVALRAWDIMVTDITSLRLSDDDVYLIQPAIQDVGWTSFDKIEYCIEQGRDAMRQALPKLQDYLKK
jgi:NTE family protein